MAKLSSDKKYVTVEPGDTLSQIAKDFLGSASKYKELAAINNIPDPNLIYVGQKIYLSSSSGGSGSQASDSNAVTIYHFGLLASEDNTLFATWGWDKSSQTESYKVLWTYDAGDGIWLEGLNSNISVDEHTPDLSRRSKYTIPSNARKVRFKVKPISKKKSNNGTGNESYHWTANWSTVKEYTDATPLETPSGTPSIKIEKYKLTTTLDNVTVKADSIEFEIVRNNARVYKTAKAKLETGHASYSCTVDAGYEYKVRCRACKGNDRSEWTGYSANEGTIPATPYGITKIRANDETSVYLEWTPETYHPDSPTANLGALAGASNAAIIKTYDIEYTTDKKYFDGSDQTTTKTGIESTHYIVSGLEPGHTYYFRIRGVNDKGASSWSEIKYTVVGKEPAAPTTWSSTTTAIAGEELNLYWVHSSEDGSIQTFAELELYIDGAKETYTFRDSKVDNSTLTYIPLSEEDREDGKVETVSIKTGLFVEGTKLEWRVRTAGITKVYGDWSIQRTIDNYAPPSLDLELTDSSANSLQVVTGFPFYIRGIAGPQTQAPIGYHLAIKSNEIYETTDDLGNERVVNAGEEVYSRYFDTFEALLVEFSAKNIDLENNISYTAVCTVAMNSGLTAEASLEFTVAWIDMECEPNAEIGVDPDTFTAYVRPYCEKTSIVKYEVVESNGDFTITDNEVAGAIRAWNDDATAQLPPVGETLPDEDGRSHIVYSGMYVDQDVLYNVYYCEVEHKQPITNVLISVYRREFDGSFTEIASDLDGELNTTVTDPHPALDLARYRIVAVSKDTGGVSYYDVPGFPVGGKAAIIQWDEAWSNFEVVEEATMEQPAWAGSMLKLPYNIDVSDNMNPDVARIEYIGREHPIAYYGTQLGHSASWSMEIEKADKETLYALRRLQRWMGDVYVREPSGSGYWANITVSFSQKHCEMTIPVSLSITRVEGGV